MTQATFQHSTQFQYSAYSQYSISMEQDIPQPGAIRRRAPQACEVCRTARKGCTYDKNYPTQPCTLCARRGVHCSLTIAEPTIAWREDMNQDFFDDN
ncbi:hypothetical protein M405DRAFT_169566 [Rhizopogon salebrosus TDB-379]|nr:hypothetical protein M405DRAFT_169566 [Rhizopogon salebrosus TDB-379]